MTWLLPVFILLVVATVAVLGVRYLAKTPEHSKPHRESHIGEANREIQILQTQLAKTSSNDRRRPLFEASLLSWQIRLALLQQDHDAVNKLRSEFFVVCDEDLSLLVGSGGLRRIIATEIEIVDFDAAQADLKAWFDRTLETGVQRSNNTLRDNARQLLDQLLSFLEHADAEVTDEAVAQIHGAAETMARALGEDLEYPMRQRCIHHNVSTTQSNN